LLALVFIYNLIIHQTGVKTTFSESELENKIYVTQPKGCVIHS